MEVQGVTPKKKNHVCNVSMYVYFNLGFGYFRFDTISESFWYHFFDLKLSRGCGSCRNPITTKAVWDPKPQKGESLGNAGGGGEAAPVDLRGGVAILEMRSEGRKRGGATVRNDETRVG